MSEDPTVSEAPMKEDTLEPGRVSRGCDTKRRGITGSYRQFFNDNATKESNKATESNTASGSGNTSGEGNTATDNG